MNGRENESLPTGWVRDENGALRRETVHSMLRRLPGWDYRKPWIYQITITCADRGAAPFGRVVVRKRGETLRLLPREPDGTGAPGELPNRFVPRATACGWFTSLGNRFLLGRPLVQVQVSRSDFGYLREPKPGGGRKIARDEMGEPRVAFTTPVFAEKRAALFAAAKRGAVLISPCVSDGERQIAREALASALPLVTLHNKGFSKLQKPSGRYFDACADGRLLMLAPAAWPYRTGEKAMTRLDATAMNRLCQWIVGEGAAEINYHGMKPENIDALARAAARVEEECVQ